MSNCSWPGRLARYVAEVAGVPALVVNAARGGASSAAFLANGDAVLRRKYKFRRGDFMTARGNGSQWAARKVGPLVDDADLVLLAFLANDFALGCASDGGGGGGGGDCFGEASERGLVDFIRRARQPGPTIALVDSALQRDAAHGGNATVAVFKDRHRALARSLNVPLVDAVYGTGGRFVDGRDEALGDAFAFHLAPRLRKILDAALLRWKGFGHFPAAYHEWVAAAVYYALVAPALPEGDEDGGDDDRGDDDDRGGPQRPCRGEGEALALCHLAAGARTTLDFDVARGAPRRSDGWTYGEDVAGKAGWITCNAYEGDSTLAFDVDCDHGDLVVGYLESYDPRMAVVNVTAVPAAASQPPVSKVVDSKDPALRSVFKLRALAGLGAGRATVLLRVLPRRHIKGRGPAACDSVLSHTPTGGMCCLRDKFKLLSLACT